MLVSLKKTLSERTKLVTEQNIEDQIGT